MKSTGRFRHKSFFPLFTLLAVVTAATLFTARPAAAGDWRFRRSYFSHQVPAELQARYPAPLSRSAYRTAVAGYLPGFSVQGGFRFNTIRLRSGNSIDNTVIYEGWFRQR